MTYTKFHDDWQDDSGGGTPITEAALDHFEAGISTESTRNDAQDGRLDAVEASLGDLDVTVQAADITDSTSTGRALVTAADAAAARSAIGASAADPSELVFIWSSGAWSPVIPETAPEGLRLARFYGPSQPTDLPDYFGLDAGKVPALFEVLGSGL